MSRRIRICAALVATVMAIAVGGQNAQAFDGLNGPQHHHPFKKMAAALGLSDQQKQQVKAIFEKYRPQTAPLRSQLVTERRNLRNLVQADTIDEAAIRAQVSKVAGIKGDMAVQHAHMGQEIRAILTPDQIAKYKAIQAKRDSRMDKRTKGCAKQD